MTIEIGDQNECPQTGYLTFDCVHAHKKLNYYPFDVKLAIYWHYARTIISLPCVSTLSVKGSLTTNQTNRVWGFSEAYQTVDEPLFVSE